MEFELPLSVEDIRKILPHRYPMLLVDRIIGFEDGVKAVGLKAVTINEPFFDGHFPGKPIMPGVLILEALAQMGVIFANLTSGGIKPEQLIVFAGADAVKWRRQVVPGDMLTLETKLIKRRAGIWKMEAAAYVGEDKAAEGILTAAETKS